MDLSRTGGRTIRAGVTGKRILDQRAWLRFLRREAIVQALKADEGRVTPTISEAADEMCELLDTIPVPGELQRGIVRKTGRLLKEKFTRGVRYPDYEGTRAATLYERLAQWAWLRHQPNTDSASCIERASAPEATWRVSSARRWPMKPSAY